MTVNEATGYALIDPLPDTYAALKKERKIDPERLVAGSRTRIANLDRKHKKILVAVANFFPNPLA